MTTVFNPSSAAAIAPCLTRSGGTYLACMSPVEKLASVSPLRWSFSSRRRAFSGLTAQYPLETKRLIKPWLAVVLTTSSSSLPKRKHSPPVNTTTLKLPISAAWSMYRCMFSTGIAFSLCGEQEKQQ
jgi:hypothetical protein